MASTQTVAITKSSWTQISGVTSSMLVKLEARYSFYIVYSVSAPSTSSSAYLIEDNKDTISSVAIYEGIALGSLWVKSKDQDQSLTYTTDVNSVGTISTVTSITNPVTVIPIMQTSGHTSVTTAATGTNWTAFGSQSLKQLTVSNQTNTTIEFRQGGSGVGFQIPSGAFYTFFGITNANQIEARRVDTANTQVTITARWES